MMNQVALSFGGGVDSSTIIAMDLNRPLAAHLLGITLDALNAALPSFNEVVFADTGAEHAHTYANVERFQAACVAAGKTFRVVRFDGGRAGDRSITEWMLRLGIVPVMGGGSHICSKKFKGDAIAKELGPRHFLIGIEANEGRRMVFTPPKGESTFGHPLMDLGITREMCLDLLPKLGFPGVKKSSCVQCPFKSVAELRDMWRNDAEAWAVCERVEAAFERTSHEKHQAWIDAGQPLNRGGRAPTGMWRKDSWAEGRRLFIKTVDGRQLTVAEWAAKFAREELIPLKLVV